MGVVKEDTQRVGVTEKNARDRVRYIEMIYRVEAAEVGSHLLRS